VSLQRLKTKQEVFLSARPAHPTPESVKASPKQEGSVGGSRIGDYDILMTILYRAWFCHVAYK